MGEAIGTITPPYRVSQKPKYRVFPKFWVKISKFLQIGQIGQVRGQITSTWSQGVKKIFGGGIQGDPTKIQGGLKIAQMGCKIACKGGVKSYANDIRMSKMKFWIEPITIQGVSIVIPCFCCVLLYFPKIH